MPELVSVIIPARNYAPFLGDAIESALNQGYERVELVVVDDGSTDETPAVLRRFVDVVQVIRLDGRGVSEARNTGLARASGRYVVFLDADDLLLPDGLCAQADYLERHADVDAVYGPWYVCDVRAGISFSVKSPIRPTDVLPRILLGNVVTTPSAMMVRRRALEAVGGFNPAVSFTADWEMWLRLATRGHRFGEVSQPVAIYRVHGKSMTRDLAKAARDVWYVLDAYFSDPELPRQAQALRREAYVAMGTYLGKLYLEQGDEEGARAQLRRVIALRPDTVDSVDFHYAIARTMWRRGHLEGIHDTRAVTDAIIRFASSLTPEMRPGSPSRTATAHLAIGLAARRAGDQRVGFHHLGAAAKSSWRTVATRRHLAVASRICVPPWLTAAAKQGLAGVGLRPRPAGAVPALVSKVMASSRPLDASMIVQSHGHSRS